LEPKLLVLLLTGGGSEFEKIFEEGCEVTWLSNKSPYCRFISYSGTNPTRIQDLRGRFQGKLRFSRFRSIQILTDVVFPHIFWPRTNPEYSPVNSHIQSAIPSLHSTIGSRTLEAFETCLKIDGWEWLWRSNVSSYINLNTINSYLTDAPQKELAAGVIGRFGRTSFLSGSGYLLSRDVVQLVVNQRSMWKNYLLDDVALGRILASNQIGFMEIPRLIVRSPDEVSRFTKKELLNYFYIRCNSSSRPRKDAEIMRAIHSKIEGRLGGSD